MVVSYQKGRALNVTGWQANKRKQTKTGSIPSIQPLFPSNGKGTFNERPPQEVLPLQMPLLINYKTVQVKLYHAKLANHA